MSCVMRIVAILALSPVVSAADCTGSPGSCKLDQDETSLMQVHIGVHRKQEPAAASDEPDTNVSAAQSAYKASAANSSVARFAAAQAKRSMMQARYNANVASFKTQGQDFASTSAGRTAMKAIVASESEAAAWKLASDAEVAAGNASDTAHADFDGKNTALYNVTATAVSATNARVQAEADAKNARIQAQFNVDRAAASASAKEAYQLKVQAAAAVAAAKTADDKLYDEKQKAKVANKASDKAYMKALKDGVKAWPHAVGAKWANMEAEAAKVDDELTASASASDESLIERIDCTGHCASTMCCKDGGSDGYGCC